MEEGRVFIQINISHSDHPIEEFVALEDDFVKATEGQRTIRRAIGCMGADDPSLRVLIAFFDSREDAEANSQLPGTDQIASKVIAMINEDIPEFINLEVKSDRSF
jgi:hypothetical protein